MLFFKPESKFLLILLFSLIHLFSYSQEPVPVQKSDNKVIIEGKIYFLHVVKAGQTLYSISRAYGLKENEVEKENPGALTGLQIGQVLKIPQVELQQKEHAETRDTSKYIHHILSKGETLFSLYRKYDVPVHEIEKVNPGIDPSDLKIGQIIFIPKTDIDTEPELTEYESHRVRRRETIYGISRMYGITEEELKQHNPELYESGLRMWQVLKIPVHKPPETIITDEVADHEEDIITDPMEPDLYSIYDADTIDDFSFRKVINVGYLIPFNYIKDSDTVPDLSADAVTLESARGRSSNPADEITAKPLSVPFLEFMEGSFLALESLKKSGLSVNVKVFDTQRSPSEVRSIIASGELDKMDIIIGPFFSFNVEILSAFSREKKIPLIVPFHDSDSLLAGNPYLFQLNPSFKTEAEAIAEYTAHQQGSQIILLYSNDQTEIKRADHIRNNIIRSYRKHFPYRYPVIRELVYDQEFKTDLTSILSDTLSKVTKNLVIVPSTNEAFVSIAVTQLFFQLKDYDIELLGMPHWSVFQNIELLYIHRLNLSFFSPYYFSYDSADINDFLSRWRRFYAAEPASATRKGCNYAFLGHDITWHFLTAYKEYGRRFILHTEKFQTDLLMNSFRFKKSSYYSGFDNISLRLIRYNPDFSILAKDFHSTEKERLTEQEEIINLP